MKNYVIIAAALAFASCTDNGDKQTHTDANSDSTSKATELKKDYCYLHTEGAGNKDTTAVHLKIDGSAVSGYLNWIPYEKDSRKGTLAGTIAGDEIRAVWSFMQEGVKDSIAVVFKLASEQLIQKPLKVDAATGRQTTDETAGYTVSYKTIDCPK